MSRQVKRQPKPALYTATPHQGDAAQAFKLYAVLGMFAAASCGNNTQLTQTVLELGPKRRLCLLECHGAGSGGSSVDLRDAEVQDAAGIDYGNQMSRASGTDWRMR